MRDRVLGKSDKVSNTSCQISAPDGKILNVHSCLMFLTVVTIVLIYQVRIGNSVNKKAVLSFR
ncbi:hypothetical protein LBYZC6_00860 [Lacrimispora brassicae]